MRIVYLDPIGGLGGAERCLLDMLCTLRACARNLDATVIAGTAGPMVEEAARLGIRAEVLAMPAELAGAGDAGLEEEPAGVWARLGQGARAAWQARRYARSLRTRLRGLAPDLVHSNGNKCHVLAWLAGCKKAPVIWHIHDFISARRLTSRALRMASSSASAIVACSEAVRADVRGVLPNKDLRTIYNAVDTGHFRPGPGVAVDALAGLPPAPAGTVRVGLVATYARWKGHAVYLRAAAEAARRAPEIPMRFYIIGGPIYHTRGSQYDEAELRALAAGLGVLERAAFVPFQLEMARVYQALDIVVHASTQPEPFGRTIIEAMACETAVIVSLAGGVGEIVTPGADALAVPPGDAGPLAEAIAALAKDSAWRKRLGRRARESVARRFSRERLGRDLLELYGNLLPERRDTIYSG